MHRSSARSFACAPGERTSAPVLARSLACNGFSQQKQIEKSHDQTRDLLRGRDSARTTAPVRSPQSRAQMSARWIERPILRLRAGDFAQETRLYIEWALRPTHSLRPSSPPPPPKLTATNLRPNASQIFVASGPLRPLVCILRSNNNNNSVAICKCADRTIRFDLSTATSLFMSA